MRGGVARKSAIASSISMENASISDTINRRPNNAKNAIERYNENDDTKDKRPIDTSTARRDNSIMKNNIMSSYFIPLRPLMHISGGDILAKNRQK